MLKILYVNLCIRFHEWRDNRVLQGETLFIELEKWN